MTLQDWEHMMKHSFESNSASQFDLGKHSIFVAYDFALEISWWDNIEEPPAEDPKKKPTDRISSAWIFYRCIVHVSNTSILMTDLMNIHSEIEQIKWADLAFW